MGGKEKKRECKNWRPFFCSQLLAEFNFHSSAEQNPPFKNPRSATVPLVHLMVEINNSSCVCKML